MSENRHEPSQMPDSQVRVATQEESLNAAPSPAPESQSESVSEVGGIIDLATDWVSNAGSRVKVMIELVMAESKLAAISVALMAFLAIISAVFLLGAWALLMAGLIYGLIQLGLPVWPVLLVLCAAHALIAFLAWRGAVKLSDNLEFPVTRQQLKQQFDNNGEEADEVEKSTKQG